MGQPILINSTVDSIWVVAILVWCPAGSCASVITFSRNSVWLLLRNVTAILGNTVLSEILCIRCAGLIGVEHCMRGPILGFLFGLVTIEFLLIDDITRR